jgi:hypothetical protein
VLDLQIASGEIWGTVPFSSQWAQVKAYRGPLPDGAAGIEFYTDVAPDERNRPDVVTEGGYAKIPRVIVNVKRVRER